MMRLRSIAAAAGFIALTGAFAFAPAGGQSSSTTATTPSPQPAASSFAEPKTLPADAFTLGDLTAADVLKADPSPAGTWTPPPGYEGSLRPENWVQITGTDSCLNVRVAPGLTWHYPENDEAIPTLNCLPDGFIGQLSFGPSTPKDAQGMPVQVDGYWWWSLLGQGWVAEDWLTLVGTPPSAARPELADAGLIAFVRTYGDERNGVWTMSADGTSERLIYPTDANTNISSLRWSADGESLVVSMSSWTSTETAFLTAIIDVDGTVIAEYAGLTEARFSPDGQRLAALRTEQPGGLGGYQTTPVVFDIATERETAVGAADSYFRAPEWNPNGSSVAILCRSWSWQEALPDGTTLDHALDCGGDGLRTVSLADGSVRVIAPIDTSSGAYYDSPSWSPGGSAIAMFMSGGECQGYALIDVASGALTTCLEVPQDSFGGRCGGGGETGASDWTPDGRTLAYHWQSGAGQNGVALVDVATGERRMILTTGSSSISFSSDGAHLSYESAGYVWTADSDTSDVSRVTDGSQPAWQPQP